MVEERYYTITQAARITGLKPHVLRYWEKEFSWLRPRKNSAGRRIYAEHDIELIRLIDRLVHQEGYSLAGARRHITSLMNLSDQLNLPLSQVKTELVERIRLELEELKEILKQERPT